MTSSVTITLSEKKNPLSSRNVEEIKYMHGDYLKTNDCHLSLCVLHFTVNAGNVIIVWSSVQCETVYSAVNGQAGTLWMERIMWPQHLPKQIFLTDCQQAHTRDQPIKTIPNHDLKWVQRVQKHLRYTLLLPLVISVDLGVNVTPF